MITYSLDKRDIINMICGVDLTYKKLGIVKNYVDYSDQYSRTTWHKSRLEALSEEQLVKLYQQLK